MGDEEGNLREKKFKRVMREEEETEKSVKEWRVWKKGKGRIGEKNDRGEKKRSSEVPKAVLAATETHTFLAVFK